MLVDERNDDIRPSAVGSGGQAKAKHMGGPAVQLSVSSTMALSADVRLCLGDHSGHMCTPLNSELMHRTPKPPSLEDRHVVVTVTSLPKISCCYGRGRCCSFDT